MCLYIYMCTANISWKRTFHDDCKYLRASASGGRGEALVRGGRRRDRPSAAAAVSCGESRDGDGRVCCCALEISVGRSVRGFIALETCRLYLHVKRVTHLLPSAWLDYSSEWCGEPHFPTNTRENWERSGYNYIKL